MTEAEFERLYQQTLDSIEASIESFLDEHDSELDYETVNGIMTLDCSKGSAIIITPQSGNGQLWLAAKSGGYHFAYDEKTAQWLRTTDAQPLNEVLSSCLLEQDGNPISFSAL